MIFCILGESQTFVKGYENDQNILFLWHRILKCLRFHIHQGYETSKAKGKSNSFGHRLSFEKFQMKMNYSLKY